MRILLRIFSCFSLTVISISYSQSSEYSSDKEYKNDNGSSYNRVIEFKDLVREMITSKDTILRYENVFFICDYDVLEGCREMIDSIGSNKVNAEVIIANSGFGFDTSHFGLTIPYFKGLAFERKFKISGEKPIQGLIFEDCNFKNGVEITIRNAGIEFIGCNINGEFVSYTGWLKFNKCDLNLQEPEGFWNRGGFNVQDRDKMEDGYIGIFHSKVFSNHGLDVLKLTHVQSFIVDSSEVLIPIVFTNSPNLRSFILKSSNLQRVSFEDLPEPSGFIAKWNDLKGKLSGDYFVEGSVVNSDSLVWFDGYNSSLEDVYLYDELIAIYKTLHEIYKSRGDMQSANGCYVEMKDVETKRLKYIYTEGGGINNYLNYKLNVWLGTFADYGTNPVKCIIYAFEVILFFAVFYLFFYYRWDNIDNKFMIRRGITFIDFFRKEQKREELYSDKFKETYHSFEQFKQKIKESKGQVPFFFYLFLKPVYWTARRKIVINEWFYDRFDFTRKSWLSLSKRQKLGYGSFYFSALLFYGLYLLVIKFLTALIISFNSFSSLGFGSLNLVGVSRYMAMLEGFIGWLLLSVFSISLFSQIIQG